MKKEIELAHKELEKIRSAFRSSRIEYDEAKRMAEPYLKVLNNEGYKVAQKFGKKHYTITFTSFMR
jgi:hypothetical protein